MLSCVLAVTWDQFRRYQQLAFILWMSSQGLLADYRCEFLYFDQAWYLHLLFSLFSIFSGLMVFCTAASCIDSTTANSFETLCYTLLCCTTDPVPPANCKDELFLAASSSSGRRCSQQIRTVLWSKTIQHGCCATNRCCLPPCQPNAGELPC